MIRFAPFLLLLVSAAAFAWPDVKISSKEYSQIRNASLKVLEKYPAPEYFILGPGRSATPFITFISELEAGRAATFPLSFYRAPDSYEKESIVRAEFKRRLDPIFQPKDARAPTQRKILVLDYTGTGYPLIAAAAAVEGYVKEHKLNYVVESLALVSSDAKKVERVQKAFATYSRAFEMMSLKEYDVLEKRIGAQDYDGYAGYGVSPIYVPYKEQPEHKKVHEAFRAALRKAMKSDPLLYIRACAKRLTE